MIKPSLFWSAPTGGRRIFLVSSPLSLPSLFSSYCPIKLAAYFSYFSRESELLEEEAGFFEVLEDCDELLELRVEVGRQEDDELFLVLELLEESLELDPRELEDLW